MALIAVEPKGKSHILKIDLDGNTHEQLTLYCAFTRDARESSVIKGALNYVFSQDSEFQEWKKNPENIKNATKPKRAARKTASTSNGQSTGDGGAKR